MAWLKTFQYCSVTMGLVMIEVRGNEIKGMDKSKGRHGHEPKSVGATMSPATIGVNGKKMP